MFKKIIDKLFCSHKWYSHSKEVFEYDEEEIVRGTEWWVKPKFQQSTFQTTTEVLICEKCGRVKKIQY